MATDTEMNEILQMGVTVNPPLFQPQVAVLPGKSVYREDDTTGSGPDRLK